MLRKIVHVSVRQLVVEQNGLAHLGFHLEFVKGFPVDPPRKGGLPAHHVVVQIKQNCRVSGALFRVVNVRISKIVVGRVFLLLVVMDQLKGFADGLFVFPFGLFVVASCS